MRQLFGAYQLNHQHQFSKHFTLPNTWKNKEAGAVIFVQDSSNGDIIQSLALNFFQLILIINNQRGMIAEFFSFIN